MMMCTGMSLPISSAWAGCPSSSPLRQWCWVEYHPVHCLRGEPVWVIVWSLLGVTNGLLKTENLTGWHRSKGTLSCISSGARCLWGIVRGMARRLSGMVVGLLKASHRSVKVREQLADFRNVTADTGRMTHNRHIQHFSYWIYLKKYKNVLYFYYKTLRSGKLLKSFPMELNGLPVLWIVFHILMTQEARASAARAFSEISLFQH